MNFKFIFCFLFVTCHLSIEISARAAFKTEIDFGNYINRSEKDLVDDTNVNWVRTDARNAYVCQGQVIKRDKDLLRLLPAHGRFMITYIYARPKWGQTLTGDLITYELSIPTTGGYVDFTFSQDKGTRLRVFVMLPNGDRTGIWENNAHSETNGVVSSRATFGGIKGPFRLVFQATVEANYPYTSRTYLSQVVVDRVVISAA